jgi:hypothetical protein
MAKTMSKEMKEAHRLWAEGMARSLDRKPTGLELENLGRVPWEAAWDAATEHAIEVFLDNDYDQAIAILRGE